MQLHIYKDRWSELSKPGQKVLRYWCQQKSYLAYQDVSNHCKWVHTYNLNIGQMIEFLSERTPANRWGNRHLQWSDEQELIEVLWEDVKRQVEALAKSSIQGNR